MPESTHEIEKGSEPKLPPQDIVYPDMKKRVLIMLSGYLAIFLITLVRIKTCFLKEIYVLILFRIGSKHHFYSYSPNH